MTNVGLPNQCPVCIVGDGWGVTELYDVMYVVFYKSSVIKM